MYCCRVARIVALFALLSVLALGSSATAQTTYYWDTTPGSMTGGSSTWSTTASNWSLSTGGDASLSAWTAGNNAWFYNGTSGTVTLDPVNAISANNVTVDTGANYTLSGGTLLASGTFSVNGTANLSLGTGSLYQTNLAALGGAG